LTADNRISNGNDYGRIKIDGKIIRESLQIQAALIEIIFVSSSTSPSTGRGDW
jgi:hypothetical protein